MLTLTSLQQLNNLSIQERQKAYVSESITSVYPIVECGEELVELGVYFCDAGAQIVLAPVAPDATAGMFLRAGAAQRLLQVFRELATRTNGGARLKVTDAFRPLWLQRKYFTEIREQIREREGLDDEALWERVTQFIADPDCCPPHTTGGAIDLTIVDANNKELDMGTSVDAIDDRANTWSDAVDENAHGNRLLLHTCMTSAGFVNLASEWWHYSYGDQYWAVLTQAPAAIYQSREDVTSA